MARKPNYDFEKRRKESERKAKKDEKAARKRDNAERGIVDPDDYVDAFPANGPALDVSQLGVGPSAGASGETDDAADADQPDRATGGPPDA